MPSCVLTRRLAAAAACLAAVALAAAPAAAQEKDLRVRVQVKGPDGKYKDTGLFRKVIVAEDGVTFHTGNPPDPNKKEGDVSPLAVFHLLKTDAGEEALAKGDDLFLRVGKAEGDHIGWLKVKKDKSPSEEDPSPSKAVIYWDTMFTLDPKKPGINEKDKKEVFRVFMDKALKSPLAQHKNSPKGFEAMAPILGQFGKEEDPIYRVAFFTGRINKGAAAAEANPLDALKLEVIFVVDTTSSMTPFLEGTKEVIARCAEKVRASSELKEAVRFGFVEYRDTDDGHPWASRLVQPLTDDPDKFTKAIAPLKVDAGGDLPEDVLAGLVTAVREGGWSKNSSKHIILVGDASALIEDSSDGQKPHPRNSTGLDIKRVIGIARKVTGADNERLLGSINFHAIQIQPDPGPGASEARKAAFKADGERCLRHFTEIASNNGEFPGLLLKNVNPNDAKERDDALNQVTSMLLLAFEGVKKIRDPKVDPTKIKATSGSDSPVLDAVFEIVSATMGKPMPVMQGYAAEVDESGRRVAQVRVLVSKKDLDFLRGRLDFLYTELKGREDPVKRQNVSKLLRILQQAAAGTVTGDEITADTDLSKVITSLPLRSGALKISASNLASMTADQFKEWLKNLDATKKRAEDLMRAADMDWRDISYGTTDESFTYIRKSDLP